MNQREYWEALSARFETAKAEYYECKERTHNDKHSTELAYREGLFNGLMLARETMAPYFLPTKRNG